MAFPRHRFGAHDRGPPLRGDRDEPIQTRREFGGCHVVGVSSESAVPPAEVHAVRACLAETSKRLEVFVCNPESGRAFANEAFAVHGTRWEVGKCWTSARN